MGFLDNVKVALKGVVMSKTSKDAAVKDEAANDAVEATPAPSSIPVEAGSADAEPTVEPKLETYTVKVGDSLPEIGASFGVPHLEIAKLNSIENPDLIFPGQVFRIPRK